MDSHPTISSNNCTSLGPGKPKNVPELVKAHDFVLLQEHWLRKSQFHWIKNILCDNNVNILSHDVSGTDNHVSEAGYKCMCLNAMSIVNKKNELNIMVEDIDPHITGITESWASIDITNAKFGLTGYVIFRRDRIGRMGGGVILYVKESIQAYEIKLEREADCDEAVWCKIVSGNSTLTIGLVYQSPNINEEEVSIGECIIMGDFNHGHIQWKSLEYRG